MPTDPPLLSAGVLPEVEPVPWDEAASDQTSAFRRSWGLPAPMKGGV